MKLRVLKIYIAGFEDGGRDCESINERNAALRGEKDRFFIEYPRGTNVALLVH